MKPTATDLRELAHELERVADLAVSLENGGHTRAATLAESLRDRVTDWAREAEIREARAMIASPENETKHRLDTAKLTKREQSALEIYVFDPAHEAEPFPGAIVGGYLEVHTVDGSYAYAREWLTEAANSADESKDGASCRVLTALATRLPRI